MNAYIMIYYTYSIAILHNTIVNIFPKKNIFKNLIYPILSSIFFYSQIIFFTKTF